MEESLMQENEGKDVKGEQDRSPEENTAEEKAWEEGLGLYMKEAFSLPDYDLRSYSPLALAFLGDAVYELIVRTVVVSRHNASPNQLNRERSALSRASAQAGIIHSLLEELTPEETAVYKRGRNAHSFTKAKNASVADYRAATGFESLLGYLYLKGEFRRAIDLVRAGMAAQEGGGKSQEKGKDR